MPKYPLAAFPGGLTNLRGIETALNATDLLDQPLLELVRLRVSQINGCGYCVDMHNKDALRAGETPERLYMLPVWREATCYAAAEQAALGLAESVTRIETAGVPSAVEHAVREHFTAEQYVALLFAVASTNAWNRLSIAVHAEPGTYQPSTRVPAETA